MDKEKVVVGIPVVQEPRQGQESYPTTIKEACQTLEALLKGNHSEAYGHAGILGFLFGRWLAR